MSALSAVKEENHLEQEKSTKNLNKILKECEDLKSELRLSENKLKKVKNENIDTLLLNKNSVELKYSDMMENIQKNSNFFENQLTISQKTIYECNQEILRLNNEIENLKMKEQNRIETENMNGNTNGNENRREIDRIDDSDIPITDMKMLSVKSKPKLQSHLVAQFNMILDQKLAGAQSEIQALQDSLRWYVLSYVQSYLHVI